MDQVIAAISNDVKRITEYIGDDSEYVLSFAESQSVVADWKKVEGGCHLVISAVLTTGQITR